MCRSTRLITKDKETWVPAQNKKNAEIPIILLQKTQTRSETQSQHKGYNSHTRAIPTPSTPLLCPARPLAFIPVYLDSIPINIILVLPGVIFMSIPKPLDKELLLVLPGTMLDDTFNFVSESRSINIDRTWIGMCPEGELVI